MTTGTKIVHGALSRLGAHSIVRPASPESMDIGKDTLNSMIASLQDDNIKTGAVPLEVVGDELSEPLGITNTIMDMLAVKLQPLFPGTQISQDLRVNANMGYQDIIRKYQAITIPKPVVRETLPIGQGNRNDNQTFFEEGDTIG